MYVFICYHGISRPIVAYVMKITYSTWLSSITCIVVKDQYSRVRNWLLLYMPFVYYKSCMQGTLFYQLKKKTIASLCVQQHDLTHIVPQGMNVSIHMKSEEYSKKTFYKRIGDDNIIKTYYLSRTHPLFHLMIDSTIDIYSHANIPWALKLDHESWLQLIC